MRELRNRSAAALERREEGARGCERGGIANASASKSEWCGRTREGTVSCDAFYFDYTRRARTSATRAACGSELGRTAWTKLLCLQCRHVQNEGLTKQIMFMTSVFPWGMRSADHVNRGNFQRPTRDFWPLSVPLICGAG